VMVKISWKGPRTTFVIAMDDLLQGRGSPSKINVPACPGCSNAIRQDRWSTGDVQAWGHGAA
jgi:hypothetical protein